MAQLSEHHSTLEVNLSAYDSHREAISGLVHSQGLEVVQEPSLEVHTGDVELQLPTETPRRKCFTRRL
jgi:hypothetical protein